MYILHGILRSSMQCRPSLQTCIKCFLSVLGIIIVGYLLLFAVYALPLSPLKQHILEAYTDGYFAENHPRRSAEMVTGKRYDMWTECTGIGSAMTDGNSLLSLLEMRYYGECSSLSTAVEKHGLDSPPQYQYMRYIHGYEILLKPLYTFFTIYTARIFIASVTTLLLLWLFVVLRQHVTTPHATIVSLAFLLPCSPNVFIMATHSAQFWLVLIAAIIATCSNDKKISPFYLFGCIGACDAFVTFLSMGSLSLSLPLLCYTLVAWAKGQKAEDIVANIFWACVGWSVGFLLPWLVKWAAVWVTIAPTAEELFSNKVEEYSTHSIGMILLALTRNVTTTHWEVWLPLFFLLCIRRIRLKCTMPANLWPILFPALIPLVWMCILPGQSGIKHSSFVNLILWPTLAVMALFLIPMDKDAMFKKLIGR